RELRLSAITLENLWDRFYTVECLIENFCTNSSLGSLGAQRDQPFAEGRWQRWNRRDWSGILCGTDDRADAQKPSEDHGSDTTHRHGQTRKNTEGLRFTSAD